MANRVFSQFQGTMERSVVKLFLKATFATGAATIVQGAGIKSFTSVGSGVYDIVLGTSAPPAVDTYQGVLAAQASFIKAATVPTAPVFNIVSDASATTGTVRVKFATDAGVATDPGDDDTLLLELTLSNSSAY